MGRTKSSHTNTGSRLGPLKDHLQRHIVTYLFYETRDPKLVITPSYTVYDRDRDVDGVIYPSLKQLYLESLDPTEWSFIEIAFDGDRRQWEKVQSSLLLGSHFNKYEDEDWRDTWRDELSLKISSVGFKKILDLASTDGAGALAAAKYLSNKEWGSRRGRPTREEITGSLAQETRLSKTDKADIKRMEEFEERMSSVKPDRLDPTESGS